MPYPVPHDDYRSFRTVPPRPSRLRLRPSETIGARERKAADRERRIQGWIAWYGNGEGWRQALEWAYGRWKRRRFSERSIRRLAKGVGWSEEYLRDRLRERRSQDEPQGRRVDEASGEGAWADPLPPDLPAEGAGGTG